MTMSDPIVVPLRSRRQQRAVLVQKLQHAIPGFVLLMAGLQTLSGKPEGSELAVALFQIAASGLLLAAMVRALHANRHLLRKSPAAARPHAAHHHGVEWGDLFAAAVMIAEGFERKMHGHHFPRPVILSAVVLTVLGVAHGRIHRFAQGRRSIRVTDDGLVVPGRPFKVRKLRASWRELQSIEVGERWAVVTTRAGRVRKLDLPDLETEPEIRAALLEAQDRIRLSEDQDGARR